MGVGRAAEFLDTPIAHAPLLQPAHADIAAPLAPGGAGALLAPRFAVQAVRGPNRRVYIDRHVAGNNN